MPEAVKSLSMDVLYFSSEIIDKNRFDLYMGMQSTRWIA